MYAPIVGAYGCAIRLFHRTIACHLLNTKNPWLVFAGVLILGEKGIIFLGEIGYDTELIYQIKLHVI
jgi:hypothetical protein